MRESTRVSQSDSMREVMGLDTRYYLLIKKGGEDRRGVRLDAGQASVALVKAGFWPLWSYTKYRKQVKAQDVAAIYLMGDGWRCVTATARIKAVVPWTRRHDAMYPLILDGTPACVLELDEVQMLAEPISIHKQLARLSFYNGTKKWGSALMGGMRECTAQDFRLLTNDNEA